MNTKWRVLLVDDNPDILETLADILAASGLAVDTALDGVQAIELFRAQTYDVAILDIMMPGLNGIETLHELRKLQARARFIMMTGYSGTGLADQAGKEDLLGLLTKPVSPLQIVKLLDGAAAGSGQPRVGVSGQSSASRPAGAESAEDDRAPGR